MKTKLQGNSGDQRPVQTVEITGELVREVADRVYRLWLADLRLERERRRLSGPGRRHR